MLSVSGADHIITMDLHASQIQVCFKSEILKIDEINKMVSFFKYIHILINVPRIKLDFFLSIIN